jgi:hypothetical protein
MRTLWLIVLVASLGCCASGGEVDDERREGRKGPVWGYFRATKETFAADEPITVEMVVHNDGDETFRFQTGGDYRFGNGRHDRFFVSFGDPDARYLSCGGGLIGHAILPKNGVYREAIDLTPWGPPGPDAKGILRVTCRRTLSWRVETKLLVDCLERQPIDYGREDARAVLIREMARRNQRRKGFADDAERQQEIERVVDAFLRFPQVQSTLEIHVSGQLRGTQP